MSFDVSRLKVRYFTSKILGFALGEIVQFDAPKHGCTKTLQDAAMQYSSFIFNIKIDK